MQLSDDRELNARRLAAATLGLLGLAPTLPAHADDAPERHWSFDNGLLYYKESGGRVQVVEPVGNVSVDLGNDRIASLGVVVDTLTGATPNGAAPAAVPQTFTGPSGGGAYTTPAGRTPLDNTFHDTRIAANLGYQFAPTAMSKLGFGLRGSVEYDFTSIGGNTRWSLDLNERNTTLMAGLSFEYDQVTPVGGAPRPFSRMGTPRPGGGDGDDDGEGGETGPAKTKTVGDLLLGVTQVIDANSLVQFDYSLSVSNGYHTDPYKLLSVVDANALPQYYVYEQRPGTRQRHALYAQYRRYVFGRDVVDLSYRYFTDSWGIRAHTLGASYRLNLGDHDYLEPSVRYYRQSAADFFRVALTPGDETRLSAASADPRLGAFDGLTGGLKYGHRFDAGGQELSLRLAYYTQTGRVTGVPASAAAALSRFDLAPGLNAVSLVLGYHFNW